MNQILMGRNLRNLSQMMGEGKARTSFKGIRVSRCAFKVGKKEVWPLYVMFFVHIWGACFEGSSLFEMYPRILGSLYLRAFLGLNDAINYYLAILTIVSNYLQEEYGLQPIISPRSPASQRSSTIIPDGLLPIAASTSVSYTLPGGVAIGTSVGQSQEKYIITPRTQLISNRIEENRMKSKNAAENDRVERPR